MAALVGYDLRIPLTVDHPGWRGWSLERRENFLLRPDVQFPLSADSYVWPSPLPEFAFASAYEERLEETLWWLDADLLSASAKNAPPGVRIALFELCREQHLPAATGATSGERLGIDIIHRGGLSGLMNYGLGNDRDRTDAVRERWGPLINQYHLFDRQADAAGYLSVAEKLEEEHGEFCLIELVAIDPLHSGSDTGATAQAPD